MKKNLQRNCGVPRQYAVASLSEMDFSIYQDGFVEEYVKDLDESLRRGDYKDEPVFVLIDGSYGNGKTRTACHLVEAAYDAYFNNSRVRGGGVMRPYFVTAQRAAAVRFDPESEIRAHLEDSVFLALDDVNRLAGYKGEQDFIEMTIEDRHNRGLSTVITMNLALESLEGRIGSFLKQFERVRFGNAPDQRGK